MLVREGDRAAGLLHFPAPSLAGCCTGQISRRHSAAKVALCHPRPTRPAAAWEGLASCYQNLGRFTAALKAYTRALELQPGRPYARIQVRMARAAEVCWLIVLLRCCSMLCSITYPAATSTCLPINELQCGTIHMALGSFAESTAQFEAALEIAPTHPAALLGAAESLAASAGVHSRQGALGALMCPSIRLSAA